MVCTFLQDSLRYDVLTCNVPDGIDESHDGDSKGHGNGKDASNILELAASHQLAASRNSTKSAEVHEDCRGQSFH